MTGTTIEGTRLVSNSEIADFQGCRRKWSMRWVYKIEPNRDKVAGALALGSRFHEGMEVMYDPSDPRDPVAFVRAAYVQDIANFPEQQEQIEKDMSMCIPMVQDYVNYVAETGCDSWFDVVGQEVPLRATILPGIDLVGRADLLARRKSDGALFIIDHKTTADWSGPLKTIHINQQGQLYALLLKLTQPDLPVAGGVWNWIKKNKRTASAKPPFVLREELWYSPTQLRSFHTRLCGIVRDLTEAEDTIKSTGAAPGNRDDLYLAYPNPSQDCSWKCEHFVACPLWDDGSAIGALVAGAYRPSDPYSRYDDIRET